MRTDYFLGMAAIISIFIFAYIKGYLVGRFSLAGTAFEAILDVLLLFVQFIFIYYGFTRKK